MDQDHTTAAHRRGAIFSAEPPVARRRESIAHAHIDLLATSKCKRRAFTLVELLVVIGIISVLLAILLPVAQSARQAAQKVACLSNLRQVHQVFTLYAQHHRDAVPIGYRNTKQFNSMVYSGGATQRFVLFGLLYPAGMMEAPGIYFCPAESNPQFQFNTSANSWPPGPDGNPALSTYSGYGARPEVAVPDNPPPGWPMPRLNAFRNKAIFADLANSATRLNTRHQTGVNVLYGHGAAYWVPRQAFEEPLSQSPEPVFAPPTETAVTINALIDEIWHAFDTH